MTYLLANPKAHHGRLVKMTSAFCAVSSKGLVREFEFVKSATACQKKDLPKVGDIIEFVLQDNKISEMRILVPSLKGSPFQVGFDFERAQKWNTFVKGIRAFFEDRSFVELRTPTLVPSPGLEPFLDPFETRFDFGKKSQNFYLPTSPEFHLKKALTLGFENCFEIKDCFRNGELGPTHQPEFQMLEWYRAYSTIESIMSDIQDLFSYLENVLFQRNSMVVENIKMEELWSWVLDFELTPQSTAQDLLKLCQSINLQTHDHDFDDIFHLLFLEKIEPFLKLKSNPVIIWHYPPSQAALARITPEGWADRFEVYWKGFELANAFHELNDPVEQRRRFEKDQEKKKSLGKKIVPIDEEFMAALEWGMPPSSGIALGVERLFMAFFDLTDLNECRLFGLNI
jgi:lysyl-tRNA synthetase class 2